MNPRGWEVYAERAGAELPPTPRSRFAGHPRRVGGSGRRPERIRPPSHCSAAAVGRSLPDPRFTCTGFGGTARRQRTATAETLDRGENLDLVAGRRSCGYGAVLLSCSVHRRRPRRTCSATCEHGDGDRGEALELTAPGNVRSGLIYRTVFGSRREHDRETLCSAPAGSTVSRSTRFSPTRSSSRNGGAIVADDDTNRAGEIFTARLQYQVNPTPRSGHARRWLCSPTTESRSHRSSDHHNLPLSHGHRPPSSNRFVLIYILMRLSVAELSSMEPFDLIILVVIGDFAPAG